MRLENIYIYIYIYIYMNFLANIMSWSNTHIVNSCVNIRSKGIRLERKKK
jgi:hypothetical protein